VVTCFLEHTVQILVRCAGEFSGVVTVDTGSGHFLWIYFPSRHFPGQFPLPFNKVWNIAPFNYHYPLIYNIKRSTINVGRLGPGSRRESVRVRSMGLWVSASFQFFCFNSREGSVSYVGREIVRAGEMSGQMSRGKMFYTR